MVSGVISIAQLCALVNSVRPEYIDYYKRSGHWFWEGSLSFWERPQNLLSFVWRRYVMLGGNNTYSIEMYSRLTERQETVVTIPDLIYINTFAETSLTHPHLNNGMSIDSFESLKLNLYMHLYISKQTSFLLHINFQWVCVSCTRQYWIWLSHWVCFVITDHLPTSFGNDYGGIRYIITCWNYSSCQNTVGDPVVTILLCIVHNINPYGILLYLNMEKATNPVPILSIIILCAVFWPQVTYATHYLNDCQKGYTYVPAYSTAGIEYVKLCENSITTIGAGNFSRHPDVIEVDLKKNLISVVSNMAFTGSNIRILNLSFNRLTSVPILQHLPKLASPVSKQQPNYNGRQ